MIEGRTPSQRLAGVLLVGIEIRDEFVGEDVRVEARERRALDAFFAHVEPVEEGPVPLTAGYVVGAVPSGCSVVEENARSAKSLLGLGDVALRVSQASVCSSEAASEIPLLLFEHIQGDGLRVRQMSLNESTAAALELDDLSPMALSLLLSERVDSTERRDEARLELPYPLGA